jgi:hypothetical protein
MPRTHQSTNALRRIAESWSVLLERREHDSAMQDPNVAAEHRFADTRATSYGEPGCPYCR